MESAAAIICFSAAVLRWFCAGPLLTVNSISCKVAAKVHDDRSSAAAAAAAAGTHVWFGS
jgi:hypothetical protein